MATYCKACGHLIHSLCKVQQEVIQRRDSFGGVRSHIICWRAIALNLTATVFLVKEQAQESCYSVAEIYGELRRDLQLLREKLHISFDIVQV